MLGNTDGKIINNFADELNQNIQKLTQTEISYRVSLWRVTDNLGS